MKKRPPGWRWEFFGSFFFLCLILVPPVWAEWQFVILGGSRDDFRRHQVFPEMVRDINQTSYAIRSREMAPEFLLHLGDFEQRRGTREALERFKERLRALRIKYYLARGNHELVSPKSAYFSLPSLQQVLKDNQAFTREYLSLFDLKETYYSFDHRNLHVVMLDNSTGTFQVKPGEENPPEQLTWLDRDLEETARKVRAGAIRHTILCAHMPPPSPAPEINRHDMLEYAAQNYGDGRSQVAEGLKLFWEILERYREKGRIARLFFGHAHRYLSYHQAGFPVTITGGAGAPLAPEEQGGFYHYLLLQVTDQGLKERIIRFYPPRKTPDLPK